MISTLTTSFLPAFAGPVIIGGDDLTDHGNSNPRGTNFGGWTYIQNALDNLIRDQTRPGPHTNEILVIGSAFSTRTTEDAGAAFGSAAIALGLSDTTDVRYCDGPIAIQKCFDDVVSGAENPKVLIIAGTDSRNDIFSSEGRVITANAQVISDFVTSGGGLLAHGFGSNAYGWLSALLPGINFPDGCTSSNAQLTAAGVAAFPLVSNSDIQTGPCHNHFTGDFGGLKILALDGLRNEEFPNGRPMILGFSAGTIECDEGFFFNGQECVPEPCEEGFFFNGQECVPEPCEEGFFFNGQECVPEPCEEGFFFNGQECVPEPEPTSTTGAGGHEPPTIGKNRAGIQIVYSNGICIDPLKNPEQCWTVTEFDTGFELLPLLTSPHTITNTIFCNEGVQECDYVGISFMTSTDQFGELVMMVEAQKKDGEWIISWYDPQDFIHDPDDYPVGDPRGAITFTADIEGNFLLTSFTIDFKNKNTNELVIRIQVGDEERGQSTFWFNEGVEFIDSDAYPSIETEFEDSLEIDSLCLNEDPDYRYSCAFAKKLQLEIERAEKLLEE